MSCKAKCVYILLQTTCEATPESQFNATTATAATRLNSNTYLETTVENNEQCIFDIRS